MTTVRLAAHLDGCPSASNSRASHSRALRLLPAQMLVEARHDLDEIAGPCAVVELRRQDAVPAVATGAGRSRQAEDVGGSRHAGGGTALDRRRPDLGMAQHVG